MPIFRKYTQEKLAAAVSISTSVQDVARIVVGRPVGGHQHQHIKKMIQKFEIDTSHFLGRAHNRGMISNHRKSADQIFIVGQRQKTHLLRRALIESGQIYKCVLCNIKNWKNQTLNLEIDHINGNNADNRTKNLRFLCPNCHSQTSTFGYRGIKPNK